MYKPFPYQGRPDNSCRYKCMDCCDDKEDENGDVCKYCCNHSFYDEVNEEGLEVCPKCGIEESDVDQEEL